MVMDSRLCRQTKALRIAPQELLRYTGFYLIIWQICGNSVSPGSPIPLLNRMGLF